jgi:hypothetical protein
MFHTTSSWFEEELEDDVPQYSSQLGGTTHIH